MFSDPKLQRHGLFQDCIKEEIQLYKYKAFFISKKKSYFFVKVVYLLWDITSRKYISIHVIFPENSSHDYWVLIWKNAKECLTTLFMGQRLRFGNIHISIWSRWLLWNVCSRSNLPKSHVFLQWVTIRYHPHLYLLVLFAGNFHNL